MLAWRVGAATTKTESLLVNALVGGSKPEVTLTPKVPSKCAVFMYTMTSAVVSSASETTWTDQSQFCVQMDSKSA